MTRLHLSLSTCAAAIAIASGATPALAGDIAGLVVDETQTVSLQSATVLIEELGRQVVTGSDGTYRIVDLPAGTYQITARYVGAESRTVTVEVPAEGTVAVDFALGGASTDRILVIGQAASQASALQRKRSSDTVGDFLTRDAIGQFPDQNVAESLRRLPGVNVLNDQGEGRFVSVRGLDPELNATSLNGVRVPAPESDVRSVALDVISSDIIESIEVRKSLTPDMDADTIGASIEISTTSAFNRRRDLLTVRLEGSYNDYADALSPKGSVDFSTRLTDDFGVSGGLSYYRREFETDNIEVAGWNEDGGLVYAEEVEYRDYDVERERMSANLNFDLRAGDTTSLYLRGLYSQFDDQEFRRRLVFIFDEAPSSGTGTSATFDDADGRITVRRDIKDRFETQRIRTISLGGETEANGWLAEYSASWARSTELENGSIDPARFQQRFDDDGLAVDFDYSDFRVPQYSVTSGSAGFLDPRGYELTEFAVTALSAAEDEEFAAQFDLAREFATDSGTFTVQGGVKSRWRDKVYDFNGDYYENDALTLDQFLGEQTYRLADMGPVVNFDGAREAFTGNFADFEFVEFDSQFDSAVEDFSVTEDVLASYLLGRWDSDTLRVIGGVRMERTYNDIRGNNVLLVEEDGTLPGGGTATEDTLVVSPVMVERSYTDWLPSLNLRFAPQENLVLRLAGYRSLVRPKLSALAPRFTVEQNDEDEREGSFGNPDLLPYEAWNFDASLEYYLSGNGAITAAAFYKSVENFIVDTFREDGVYRGIAFDEATIPINGESGEIFGVELGYSQTFDMLPAPFDGLLMQANYTWTDASGMVPIEGDPTNLRSISLPTTSRHTANLTFGYDRGPLDLRISGTYRSGYLDELADVVEEDRLVENHLQIDLSAKYRITDSVQVFYEWVNINNAKYTAFNTFGGQRNLLQYEEYSWTMKAGVRVNF